MPIYAPRRGFTLIELLIVVAIIAILAAIAVPNFLEAQTRAKVARVKNDLRTIALGMEAYRVDHNHYAIPSAGNGRQLTDPLRAYHVTPFETRVPVLLTTPIAYISSRPADPFAVHEEDDASPVYLCLTTDYLTIRQQNNPRYNYREVLNDLCEEAFGRPASPRMHYMLVSFGPDLIHSADIPHSGDDHQDDHDGHDDDHDDGEEHDHTEGAVYDPTNGTISNGDIFYLGPGIGFP